MLTDDGELFFVVRRTHAEARDPVDGNFDWRGKESGHTTHGTGIRVMQAERTLRK